LHSGIAPILTKTEQTKKRCMGVGEGGKEKVKRSVKLN
jgi:hypothetical protein